MIARNPILKVGFIGLGHMGAGMAGRLLNAGHDVTVYNRTASKARPLADRGAHLVSRIAEGFTRFTWNGEVGYGMTEYIERIEDGKLVGFPL